MSHLTIETLLSTRKDLQELARHLEYCQSLMVAYLKHAPEQLEDVIESYESIYLLRQALENYQPQR